ncbi:MAG: hypothetical protein QW841_05025 [Candidatus Aenigmatarchaeota archaeon]
MLYLMLVRNSLYLLYGEEIISEPFVIIKESNRQNKIPPGLYVVKLLEYKEIKEKQVPFVSIVKKLNKDSLIDFVLDISELNFSKQEEVVSLLEKYQSELSSIFLFELNTKRIKNLLNCISIYDKKHILFSDIELEEDDLLKEIDIEFKKVKEVRDALLRDRQKRKDSNIQRGFYRLGNAIKNKEREKTELDSSKEVAKAVDNS